MNYSLIKLSFDTAVHFGSSDSAYSLATSEDHICADTLFSALCHTTLQLFGENGVNKLNDEAVNGAFVISDTMPWHGNEYYLPKPCVISKIKKSVPEGKTKAMKKLEWVPLSALCEFCNSVNGKSEFDPDKYSVSFGAHEEVTKAAVNMNDDALPYRVGTYRFNEDCGLYIIVGTETYKLSEYIAGLIKTLGLVGIGGKTSSGYGKFHIEKLIPVCPDSEDESIRLLYKAMTKENSCYLLLSTSLPENDEMETVLDGAAYRLIRRSGFVASDTYSKAPMKKQTQYYFCAGSTFRKKFTGGLYDVGRYGAHSVYRLGKPLFMGVEL